MVDLGNKGNLVERTKKDAASFITFLNRFSLKNLKDKLTTSKSCPAKTGIIAFILGLIFLFIVVPVFIAIIGLVNLNACASQKMIPIWLVVFAAVVLANVIFNFIGLGIVGFKLKVEMIQRIIDFIVLGFLFIWVVVGSIWVFTISSIMNNGFNGCDKFCYMLAFWLLIVLWAAFVLAILAFIGFKVFQLIYSKLKK